MNFIFTIDDIPTIDQIALESSASDKLSSDDLSSLEQLNKINEKQTEITEIKDALRTKQVKSRQLLIEVENRFADAKKELQILREELSILDELIAQIEEEYY